MLVSIWAENLKNASSKRLLQRFLEVEVFVCWVLFACFVYKPGNSFPLSTESPSFRPIGIFPIFFYLNDFPHAKSRALEDLESRLLFILESRKVSCILYDLSRDFLSLPVSLFLPFFSFLLSLQCSVRQGSNSSALPTIWVHWLRDGHISGVQESLSSGGGFSWPKFHA